MLATTKSSPLPTLSTLMCPLQRLMMMNFELICFILIHGTLTCINAHVAFRLIRYTVKAMYRTTWISSDCQNVWPCVETPFSTFDAYKSSGSESPDSIKKVHIENFSNIVAGYFSKMCMSAVHMKDSVCKAWIINVYCSAKPCSSRDEL